MLKSTYALITAAFLLASTQASSAQAPAYAPNMTFDVASIRQSNPDVTNGFVVGGEFSPVSSSHFSLENNSFWNLLLWAYPVEGHRIIGLDRLPAELQHATFNVQARADQATDERLANLPKEQRVLEQQHMIQVLLAERFNLKVQRGVPGFGDLRSRGQQAGKTPNHRRAPNRGRGCEFWRPRRAAALSERRQPQRI